MSKSKYTEEQIEALKNVMEWAHSGMVEFGAGGDRKNLKIVKDMMTDIDFGDWDYEYKYF